MDWYRRVVFQPYSRQQLETIAKTRLEGLNVFEPRAIEYAARKVDILTKIFATMLKMCNPGNAYAQACFA